MWNQNLWRKKNLEDKEKIVSLISIPLNYEGSANKEHSYPLRQQGKSEKDGVEMAYGIWHMTS